MRAESHFGRKAWSTSLPVIIACFASAFAGCVEKPNPPDTASLLFRNDAARRAMRDGGQQAERHGRELVGEFLARLPLPSVVTVTEYIGHQYSLEDYVAQASEFCGREVAGRRRSAVAVGGSMYRWYEVDLHQQTERCLPYWKIERIESGRPRNFLGYAPE